MTIDELLQQAANSGRLVGLTLYPTPDGKWQAATTQDRVGWNIAIAPDIATALRKILGDDQPKGAFE